MVSMVILAVAAAVIIWAAALIMGAAVVAAVSVVSKDHIRGCIAATRVVEAAVSTGGRGGPVRVNRRCGKVSEECQRRNAGHGPLRNYSVLFSTILTLTWDSSPPGLVSI
jgi:hypothetical protein